MHVESFFCWWASAPMIEDKSQSATQSHTIRFHFSSEHVARMARRTPWVASHSYVPVGFMSACGPFVSLLQLLCCIYRLSVAEGTKKKSRKLFGYHGYHEKSVGKKVQQLQRHLLLLISCQCCCCQELLSRMPHKLTKEIAVRGHGC